MTQTYTRVLNFCRIRSFFFHSVDCKEPRQIQFMLEQIQSLADSKFYGTVRKHLTKRSWTIFDPEMLRHFIGQLGTNLIFGRISSINRNSFKYK